MKLFDKWYVRVAAFFAGFLLICIFMELAVLKVNTVQLIAMTDMENTESADIYFVGSSWFQNQVAPTIVAEETGMSVFNASSEGTEPTSKKAILRQVLKTKSPKYVFVDFDVRSYYEAFYESPAVQGYIWPFLDLDVRAEALITEAQKDGMWLDRMFPWRFYHAETVRNLGGNTLKKLFPTYYRDHYVNMISNKETDRGNWYTGLGHFAVVKEGLPDYTAKYASHYTSSPDGPLNEESAYGLLELKKVCDANDCELIIMVTPFHRGQVLSDERFLKGSEALADFCRDNDIPLWNFIYVRDEVMDSADNCFYDENHLTVDGTQRLSSAIATIFNAYVSGEDVSSMFYTKEEFLASIDSIINTYYEKETVDGMVQVTARVNAGTPVKPVYKFTLEAKDGSVEVLRDYSAEHELTLQKEQLAGKTLRVYAKNAADETQPECCYP